MTPELRQMDAGLELKDVIDRELERLHKLVEQGKEVAWATAEISRFNRIVCQPPTIISESLEPKKERYPWIFKPVY